MRGLPRLRIPDDASHTDIPTLISPVFRWSSATAFRYDKHLCISPRPYIQKTELKPLLEALGMAVTDAELKVALASVDADGSGDVSFSEFYAWFARGGGGGGDHDGLDEMMSDVDTRSQLSGPSVVSPGSRSTAVVKRGLQNAARSTFVKVPKSSA